MALAPDFMAQLAATKGDPSAFSELVFGTPLHAGQRRYAANAHAEVNFLLPGNSFGKTEFIVRFATYCAWHKVDYWRELQGFQDWLEAKYNVLIASYNYPIAKESFLRLEVAYQHREEVQAIMSGISRADPVEVKLSNGSLIRWGSLDGGGKLVEATRYNKEFVDEAGHIPDISDTFDNILFPRTMGVAGQIHLLGTPKAHSDPYLLEIYDKGRKGDDPFYYSQDGSALENEFWPESEKNRVLNNPRYVTGWRPAHDPAEECENLACRNGEHPVLTKMGGQVILGRFILAGGYFFNRQHVQNIFRWDEGEMGPLPDLSDESYFSFEPIPGHLYGGAFDLAGNKMRRRKKPGSDPTVGFVVDYTTRPWRIVHFHHIEGGDADWEQKYELMKDVYVRFGLPYLIIDATGQIDSVQEALQNRGVEVEGMTFGGNSNRKFDMLRNLQVLMEMEWEGTRGVLRCPPLAKLKYELDHYVIPDDDIRQDCIMALAMVCFDIAQYELPPAVSGEVF